MVVFFKKDIQGVEFSFPLWLFLILHFFELLCQGVQLVLDVFVPLRNVMTVHQYSARQHKVAEVAYYQLARTLMGWLRGDGAPTIVLNKITANKVDG